MRRDDAQEYSESLGLIGAGWWRQVAWAHRQGVPAALGMTTREWVGAFMGGWQRLPLGDRREAVLELTTGPDALSQRAAADVLGVDVSTVNRDLGVANATPGADPERGGVANATPAPPDGPPGEGWALLLAALDALRAVADAGARDVAASVPERRRAGAARAIRRLGTALGAVALELEGG